MIKFALGILSYNHPEITKKCIHSVLQQGLKSEFIFLLHNGSLPQHIDTLKKEFPHINHIIKNENAGFTAGANLLFASIFNSNLFEQILFLSNDTELIALKAPSKIHNLASVKVLKRKTEQIDSIIGLINTKTGNLQHLKEFKSELSLSEKYYVPGSAFWISKNAFTITQGFDESFHSYWEDVDLSLRLQIRGYPLETDLHTVVSHKIGKTCHKNRFYTYYLFCRNRLRCMRKNNFTNSVFYFYFLRDLYRWKKNDSKYFFEILKEVFYARAT